MKIAVSYLPKPFKYYIMKKLFLATAFAVAGVTTVSAQTTPQQKIDTVKTDSVKDQGDMKHDHNNMNSNATTDTTGTWKSKDATKKTKKKNK